MKTLNELRNLLEDSRNFTKIHSMNSNDFGKICSSVMAYEPCKSISNLNVISENYWSSGRREKSFLEWAKSGHLNHQNKSTNENLYSTLFPEYGMYYTVSESIEFSANSEDGEVVEVESEDSDIQTDDSDDSGDGDDDDPSHTRALTFVSNNFYCDKQSKARTINNFSFFNCINLIIILINLISSLLTIFSSKPFPIFKIHIFIVTLINELLNGIIDFIISGSLLLSVYSTLVSYM